MRVQGINTKFEGSAWVSCFEVATSYTARKLQYAVDYCADGVLIQTVCIGDTVAEAIQKARAKGL